MSTMLEIAAERNGGRATLVVTGEVDLANVDVLRDGGQQALRAAEALELDLTGVEFMDSSGLRALLELQEQAVTAGCKLRINPSPSVLRLLEIAGLSDRFALAEAG